MNINSIEYWEQRFFSGNWGRNGRRQTSEYAKANSIQINLGNNFYGSILDFGCALGDAIPIYKRCYPSATLSGFDISESAIAYCRKKYSGIASFYTGEIGNLQFHDVIIASHVMEHLPDDKNIIKSLLTHCNDLYVFVPYKETPLYKEHVNYYEEDYYDIFSPKRIEKFRVAYKRINSLGTVIRNALKFRIQLRTNFSKEIIMYHISPIY